MNDTFKRSGLLAIIMALLGSLLAWLQWRMVEVNHPNSVLVSSETPMLAMTSVQLPPAPAIYQPRLRVLPKETFSEPAVSQAASDELQHKAIERPTLTQSLPPVDEANSDDLATKLRQVMADMADEQASITTQQPLHAQSLSLYPAWYQDLVPALDFSAHIYASSANERWVRVNNQVVKEGELINASMRLVKIEPQQVVIQMQQRRFSLPALGQWPGN